MRASNQRWSVPIGDVMEPFQVVAVDGQTLQPSARYMADTINVGPGQRYAVIWTARNPGKWLIHSHIGHHTTNDNVVDKNNVKSYVLTTERMSDGAMLASKQIAMAI